MDYEAVIGLEVHVQLDTRTKMFCGCPNDFGGEPNTRVCPVCLGYPGALPAANREAVRKALVAGLMCGCEAAARSRFHRKSYFYPDMPRNYQISQYDQPLCRGGSLLVGGSLGFSGAPAPVRRFRLARVHLEEDTGKLTHMGDCSGVDFNRAGVPLLEIVTCPDLHTPDDAYDVLTALKQTLQYAGVSACDMEKGQLRCDVNVSVRPCGQEALGAKVELKNLNSFRAVYHALEYETRRQTETVRAGGAVRQETRGWDEARRATVLLRAKEEAHDYRYIPEPDLPPLEIPAAWVAEIAAGLPEGPVQRRTRFVAEYGLTAYEAAVLTADKALADYFEEAARSCPKPRLAAGWVITELAGALAAAGLGLAQSPVSPRALGELVSLVAGGPLSGRLAKDVFAEMFRSGRGAHAIVAERGLRQVSDAGALAALARQAVAANPRAAVWVSRMRRIGA